MTITEYKPIEVTTETMAPEVYQHLPQGILADGPLSGDHKVIGRLWIIGSLLFGLFVLVADILVRIERLDTDSVGLFTNATAYEQWFTLHRVGLVFLFVVPLLIGIATVMVPLQIGAPSVAFPRASSAALWTWGVAGVMLVVSWAIDGGLVSRPGAVSRATQLSMISLAAVVLALVVASMVIITTIFTERSQGMSLYNVPLFTWSMLVACGIWVLSFPVLIANLIVMWVDARGEVFHSFGGERLYDQISWVFDQPQVFAFAIPVLGMLGDIAPVAFRRRLKQYDVAMVAIGAFGGFTFGAYAQTFFNPGANTTWLYVVGSITLLLPILAFLGSVGLTAAAANGAPKVSAQLILAVTGLLALLTAGAMAAVRVLDSLLAPIVGFVNWIVDFLRDTFGTSSVPFNNSYFRQNPNGELITNQNGAPLLNDRGAEVLGGSVGSSYDLDVSGGVPTDVDVNNRADWLTSFENWLRTSFDEVAGSSLSGAMLQLALVAGLLAAAAGLFYWAPKIFGSRLPAGAGFIIGLSLLGGAVLSALPDAISGFLDQPDFVAASAQEDGVEILNLVSLVGSFGVLAGLGMLVAAIGVGLIVGDRDDEDDDIDPNDPWGGHTLEWLTASPPVPGNFAGPLVVTSEAPLRDDDFVNPYSEVSA